MMVDLMMDQVMQLDHHMVTLVIPLDQVMILTIVAVMIMIVGVAVAVTHIWLI